MELVEAAISVFFLGILAGKAAAGKLPKIDLEKIDVDALNRQIEVNEHYDRHYQQRYHESQRDFWDKYMGWKPH